MSCIDVCLAKRRRDSGVKWKQQWESVGTAEWVFVGEPLWLGRISW